MIPGDLSNSTGTHIKDKRLPCEAWLRQELFPGPREEGAASGQLCDLGHTAWLFQLPGRTADQVTAPIFPPSMAFPSPFERSNWHRWGVGADPPRLITGFISTALKALNFSLGAVV